MILKVELARRRAVHLNGFENLREAVSQTYPGRSGFLDKRLVCHRRWQPPTRPDTTHRETRCNMLGREDVGVGIFVAWGRADGTITPDAMSPMLGWVELGGKHLVRRTLTASATT